VVRVAPAASVVPDLLRSRTSLDGWWALLDLNQRATDYEFWTMTLLRMVRPRYSLGLSVC
jgi:hypothetical protein